MTCKGTKTLILLSFLFLNSLNNLNCQEEFDELVDSRYTSIEDEEEEHPELKPEDNINGSSDLSIGKLGEERNISTGLSNSVIFPDYLDYNLPAGLPIRVLIVFLNNFDQPLILRYAYASLHHVKQYAHTLQNFSAFQYDIEIPPKVEVTVQYNFWPHHSFADRPFILSINTLLTDNDTDHKVLAYNATHTFYELNTSNLDFQLFSIVVIIIASFGSLGYFLYEKYFKSYFHSSKKTETSNVEIGTKSTGVDYAWLPRECVNSNGYIKLISEVKNLIKRKVA